MRWGTCLRIWSFIGDISLCWVCTWEKILSVWKYCLSLVGTSQVATRIVCKMRQGLWYPQEKVWKGSETVIWKRPLEWVFLAVCALQPEVMPLLSNASLFQEWQGLQGLQTLHSSFGLNSSNAVKTSGPRVSCSCWLENSKQHQSPPLCSLHSKWNKVCFHFTNH